MTTPRSERSRDNAAGDKKRPKLRATCDACIAAKIRCGRNIPQCFRCQVYNIKCVYGVSRRMGRPRKSRCDAPGEREQNNNSAEEEDEERLSKEKTTVADTQNQDAATLSKDPPQALIQREEEHSTSTRLSPTRILSATPLLVTEDNFTTSSDYSFSTPSLQDNVYVLNASPVIDSFSRAHDFSELNNPTNTPCEAHFSKKSHDTACRIEDQLSLNAPTDSQLDDFWSMDEQPNFSDIINLDDMDFSLATTSGEYTHLDNQNSFEPSRQDLEHQRALLHLGSSPKQAARQTLNTIDLTFSRCDCYKSTLRLLLHLNETLLSTSSLTLDIILKLDKEVFIHNQKVLQCNICAGTSSNQVLLQTILMDRTIGMLESKFRGRTRSASLQSVSSQQSQVRRHHDHESYGLSRLPGGSGLPQSERDILASAKECTLQVGGYEVSVERNIFIKQLLQMRLTNLMAALRGLEKKTNSSVLQDSNAKVAGMMLIETGLKLRKLVGRVELWSM